ncbi:MAG: hypothetical protein KF819_12110 [Labilithrix sp.]|nr:hypothetical protein [Labilithrix sp.]
MPRFGHSDVLVRGRSRRGLALVLGIVVPLVLAVLCEVTGNGALQPLVALLVGVEAIVFFFLPAIAPEGILTGEQRGALKADREGIVFRGKRILAREQIRNVAVEPQPGGARIVRVSAQRARDGVDIEIADDEGVRALLDALELAYDAHVATFSVEEGPLRSPGRRLLARGLVIAGALAIVGGVLLVARREELVLLAMAPLLLVYALVVPRARLHADVVLGADGLVVRFHGKLRTISLASIIEARSVKNEVTLVLGDESVLLRFGPDADVGSVQSASFVARLRQARVRLEGPREREPVEALLARGTRAADAWVEHLRAIGAGDDGYRTARVPDEALWRVVEAAGSEPTARVGAMIVLRERAAERGAEEVSPRLRVLAERTAGHDLRAAMEAAAEGDADAAIVSAYDRASRS